MTLDNILIFHKNKIRNVLVYLLFFSLAIDMGGDFGLRNIALPVGMLFLVFMYGVSVPNDWLLPFGILVVYPSALLLIGITGGAELPVAISQFQSTVLAFVVFLFVYRIPYAVTSKVLLFSLFSVALLAVGLAIGLILGIDAVSGILSMLADKGGGYFGERGVGVEEIVPNVYFKATLFFVSAFVLSIFTKRYWFAGIFFLALVAGVSKTGMLITGFVLLIYLFWNKNIKGLLFGSILLVAVVFFVMQSPLFILFDEIAKNESATVNTRAGHFESLVSLWSDNPLNLLFGFGLGSTFYSSGAGAVVSNIEIDHFNVVRKYGFLWAMLFFSWVIKVAYTAIKNNHDDVRGMGWGLLLAFIVAGTNPVLISPLFFLFLFLTMAANHQTAIRNES